MASASGPEKDLSEGRQPFRQRDTSQAEASPEPEEEEPSSWLGQMTEQFQPEISALRALAVGAALGVAREVVVRGMPRDLGDQLSQVFNNLTSRLGGQPVSMSKDDPGTRSGAEHQGPHGKKNGSQASRQHAAAEGETSPVPRH
jgi:hypothetical protein